MATKLQKKVVRILKEEMPDIKAFFEPTDSGLVTGAVVSRRFARMQFLQRQRLLQRVLRKGLTADENQKVGTIAALTPAEAEVPA